MKIIGKNSLLYWAKYPFLIYTVLFVFSSVWICSLIVYYLATGTLNSLINKGTANSANIIQFRYPLSEMVLATKNSTEGILLAFFGIVSICFVMIYAYRIIKQLASDAIFTNTIVSDFRIMGTGLIIFGIITPLIDLTIERNTFNYTPSLLYVVTGFILLFVKEIFAQGKTLQDQTDLTI